MNVLLINTTYNRGGAAQTARDIKMGLGKKGHQTSMFVSDISIPNQKIYKINSPIRKKISYLLSSDIDFFESDQIIHTEEFNKADIIHCHNLHGGYFKLSTLQKMSKIKPVIWTLHDMWAVTPHCAYAFDGKCVNGFYQCPSRDIYPKLLWPNERYLTYKKRKMYESSKFTLTVPSLWLKNKLRGTILSEKPCHLICHGLNLRTFNKTPKSKARSILRLPINKSIILFIANGGKANMFKGWQYTKYAIDKYAHNRNVLGLCIGNDTEYTDGNIRYLTQISDPQKLALYYSACDVFLFTSTAENMPLVPLEAMACGALVVSFDVGGVKEAISHKNNGYLAKYKSGEDVINGIDFFLKITKKELKQISSNAVKTVANRHDINNMVDNFINLYETVAHK